MAHLNWHGKIVEVWQNKEREDTRYHVTDTGRVIRTVGPRNGGAKVVRKDKEGHVYVGSMRPGTYADIKDPAVVAWLERRATKVSNPTSAMFIKKGEYDR